MVHKSKNEIIRWKGMCDGKGSIISQIVRWKGISRSFDGKGSIISQKMNTLPDREYYSRLLWYAVAICSLAF